MTKNVVIAIAFFALTMVGTPVFAQRTQPVIDLYNRQEYSDAIRQFKPIAENGDQTAQLYVGVMLLFGQGTETDYPKARQWLEASSSQGNTFADYYLGIIYHKGLGIPKRTYTASQYLGKAAAAGVADANYFLGAMYRSGDGVSKNIYISIKYLKAAAEKNSADAANALGEIFELGEGVPKNSDEAGVWFAKAKSLGVQVNPLYAARRNTAASTESASRQNSQDQLDLRSDSQSVVKQNETAINQLHEKLVGRRVAFLIGNDDYRNIAKLEKAVGDIRDIKKALEEIGFSVTTVENVDFTKTTRAIADFQAKISQGDVVFFHFSGHGVQIDNQNFLLPTDFPAVKSTDSTIVKSYGIAVEYLVNQLFSSGARVVVAVLDACRENPFKVATGTRGIGSQSGLAQMTPPEGSFIIYSAGAGQLALDRLNDNDKVPTSVFTRAFVPLLKDRSLSLIDIAKTTQLQVRNAAQKVGHVQTPAYYDQIVGVISLAE